MKRSKLLIIIVIVILIVIITYTSTSPKEDVMRENLEVTSSAFAEGERIPPKYSGEAEEISPPLALSKLDEKAKSIAIIMQDINSPVGSINHWVLFNIPITCEIPENIPRTLKVEKLGGALQGRNLMRQVGYMGPKPPWGTHTYTFYVYVLDTILDLKAGASKRQLLKSMNGHILQYGTLSGDYTKGDVDKRK